MKTFVEWLTVQPVEALLRLIEAAAFFDPTDYNVAFEKGLESVLSRIRDTDLRQQVSALRGFDWGNYIARSLRRSGIRDENDIQEHLHEIVVKLLLSPGKLFQGWNPQRHGPLDRRFKRSVWNAIRNIAEKQRNRRWVAADPTVMADRLPGRQPYSGLLDDFRRLVGERLGRLAAAILDWRLQGLDTKELVGKSELGSPSSYAIKREVQGLKDFAQRFAAQSGDPRFLNLVTTAMDQEAQTVGKRQRAVAGRIGGG